MFRKVTIALIAAAALGAAALASSAVSAGGSPHHQWSLGWSPGYSLSFGGFTLNSGARDCYQQLWIPSSRGTTLRTVNVCGYTAY
jgi:hypothetical protein